MDSPENPYNGSVRFASASEEVWRGDESPLYSRPKGALFATDCEAKPRSADRGTGLSRLVEAGVPAHGGSLEPKADRFEHFLILLLAVGALLGSFVLQLSSVGGLEAPIPFSQVRIQLPETCMSLIILNIPCPGCGLTRSFVALSSGNIRESFRFNSAGPFIYLLCLLQIPYRLVELLGVGSGNRGWTLIKTRSPALVWLTLVGLLASWIGRLF